MLISYNKNVIKSMLKHYNLTKFIFVYEYIHTVLTSDMGEN